MLGIYFTYDVKQADPAEWSSPPFEAALVDKPGLGKALVGRGAINQKGPQGTLLDKRWVVVAPPGATESRLLLARAVGEEQASRIGNQTGGRVSLFLSTDDFWRDYHAYRANGVVFVREPKEESYGTVAVFKDLYGTLWDLVQFKV
jgi:hypothetical protein